jgi:glucosyl-dolichyl phosphate glucuronosyltransferase
MGDAMSRDEFDISVILATYTEERWQHLVNAVQSLREQTFQVCEIIVVVDGNPHLLERIRRELPDVVASENLERPGSSGAHNTGINLAKSKLVALLDDDATAEPDWLECLIEHVSDPAVIAAGGSSLPVWQQKQPRWFPMEFGWVVGCSYTGMPQQAEAVRNVWACLCARRDYLVRAGGFRDDLARVGALPTGGDETELCLRLADMMPQGRFMYEPRARIHHFVPLSRARWRYFLKRCYQEGKSKALIACYVGTRAGLQTERSYTARILPRGVLIGLRDTFFHGDISGLMRAGAIIAGLLTTTMGYLAPKPRMKTKPGASTVTEPDVKAPDIVLEQDGHSLSGRQ